VAMCDYAEELRVGKEILARVVESYRKTRNTLRYLVSNLYDFKPGRDSVPLDRMEEVDRYMLARYGEIARRILQAYDEYDYPTIFQTVNAFMSVDLSALYSDISKDRLYTFAPSSRERRSAQTAMYIMADGFARLLAPILPVTAEQLWTHLPEAERAREESVHLALFPTVKDIDALVDRNLLDEWERLLAIRDTVNASLEELRQAKQIGNSLQARVTITASGQDLTLLKRYEAQLPMLFIVSEVELAAAPGGDAGYSVAGARTSGVKCERCWRYVPKVSSDPVRPGICERCEDALAETVPRQARDALSPSKGVRS
jgi:isoleucyl-tRNA synthetase